MAKFKAGDKVKVVADACKHGFPIFTILTIRGVGALVERPDSSYMVEEHPTRYVTDEDIEFTNEMTRYTRRFFLHEIEAILNSKSIEELIPIFLYRGENNLDELLHWSGNKLITTPEMTEPFVAIRKSESFLSNRKIV